MEKRFFRRVFFILLFFSLTTVFVFTAGEKEEEGVEKVRLSYWSIGNFPGYDDFWVEVAERFNAEHPEVDLELELTLIPYSGYEARYQSAFGAGAGPDIFWDMTHHTAGQLEVSEKMPADLARKLDSIMGGPGSVVGMFDGTRYGIPVEGGYFQMMFINVPMYKEAGLDPDKPAKTYSELLEHAKKLVTYDGSGRITRSGFAIRYDGHPFGIADKTVPFIDAWGAELLDWKNKKASGHINSPEAIAAMTYYQDLVRTHKVASLEMGEPMESFGRELSAIMFRESFAVAWLKKFNPDLEFKVYPLPSQARASGYAGNFPWSIQVNKDASESSRKWAWELMRYYVDNPEIRKEHAVVANIIPPFTDILEEPEFKKHQAYDAFVAMSRGRGATNYHIPPAQELLKEFGDATLDIIYGREKVKPALDKAAAAMDAILVRYK
jgi:ABC-type glycerol-3-phosphate transport system substrate-binding protein